ncbi:hypothetical protein M8J75_005171 [Diaphorina citri]|nr:hypothetical protein M8J75_005171 [Diaphorina citri]KAI5744003.1 hypothetical protein M8J77_024726 [Diaphorina citri]
MRSSCVIVLCVCLGAVLAAPRPSDVFQRNGLQREQEGNILANREPFEPQSPFQLSHPNVQVGGNTIVVPPTIQIDPSPIPKTSVPDTYLPPTGSRNFLNHFEILNKDALVGLLIEKDIPFYVKTVVEPMKPPETRIHVMRIPKKHEVTSPLPDLNLNMVEIVQMNATKEKEENDQEAYKADDVKQVANLVKQSQKGSKSDVIVKVTERRPDDISVEQETPVITVTDPVQASAKPVSIPEESPQGDDPNAGAAPPSPTTVTPVYEHAIIYTPEKEPGTKSIWEHIETAYGKAKEKTSEIAGKAKVKAGELIDKAREKAKDVLDSDENSKEKGVVVNPADDI